MGGGNQTGGGREFAGGVRGGGGGRQAINGVQIRLSIAKLCEVLKKTLLSSGKQNNAVIRIPFLPLVCETSSLQTRYSLQATEPSFVCLLGATTPLEKRSRRGQNRSPWPSKISSPWVSSPLPPIPLT